MRLVALVVIVSINFLMLPVFAAELAVPQQVLDLQKSAETAVQQKDFQTALNLYARISSSFPVYAMDAQRDITTTHLISGNKQLANEELKKMWVHRANPRFVEAMQRIKDQYWWSGYGPESQTLCEQIMAACPDDPQTMTIHGDYIRGFIALGTPEKAKPSLESLITRYRQNPKVVPILAAIKDQYWWGGYSEQSQSVCEHILATYPDDPQTMAIHGDYIRGCILTGNLENAKPSLDSFMTRYGKNAKIVPILASIKTDYWFSGHQQESQALCESIITTYPDDPQTMSVHADYIRGCILTGNLEKAKQSLDSFMTRYGRNEKIVSVLAEIKSEYWLSGHQQESQALCESIMSAYPDDPQTMSVHADYIRGCIAMGHDEDFSEEFEAYWNKYHDQPDFFVATQGIVSECLYSAHDLSRALEISLRLLKNYPSHEKAIETERDVITIYLEMGAKELVNERLEKLKATYASNANLPAVLIHLGERYRFQQQYQECISLHQAALALKPAPNEQVEAYAGMAKAAARMQGAIIDPNAPAATGTDVDAIVQTLLTNYKDNQRLGFHVFQIAEEYYFRAEKAISNGNRELARPDFEKAIAIWQKNIDLIDDPFHKAMAADYSGVSCQFMGRSDDAVGYYEQIVSKWPDYDRRWHALSALARLYEEQSRMDKLSRQESNTKIKNVYQEIIQKYPTSPGSQVAASWLKENTVR